MLTGKGMTYGSSLVRPEATGFGAVYFTEQMLADGGNTLAEKRIAVSGFDNVTWGVVLKAAELDTRLREILGATHASCVEYGTQPDALSTTWTGRTSRAPVYGGTRGAVTAMYSAGRKTYFVFGGA